jgi:hypothetical protein
MPRGAADLCVNAGFPGRQGSGKLELEPYGRYRQHGQPRKSGVGLLIFMEQGGLPAALVLVLGHSMRVRPPLGLVRCQWL